MLRPIHGLTRVVEGAQLGGRFDGRDGHAVADISPALLSDLETALGSDAVRGAAQVALLDPGAEQGNLAAGLAVRPATADDVAQILRLCAAAGVGVVAQGGRTGLSGAALTSPGQIILLSDRLGGGVEIDPLDRTALVGAGVTLEALQEAAALHGLSSGIDLAARGTATVGGMIATNAGGMEAFRFGMMRQRLLGLEGVLADGTVVSDLTRVAKANEGYDLKQLFCGSEGTLGIVTRAVLRLEQRDPPGQTALLAVRSAADAVEVMRDVQNRGALLLAEIMWRAYAHAAAEALGLARVIGFCDAPVYLVLSLAGGSDEAVEAFAPAMEAGLIHDAILAQNDREAADIWRIREDSFAAERGIAHRLWFDISVPLSGLDAYVSGLEARLAGIDPHLQVFILGHLGDGNLHLTIARDAPLDAPGKLAVERAVEAGLRDAGGAISAEHGIGTEKRASLARCLPPGKLHAMRLLKQALDPKGILNPGKIFAPG
ncbi:MAG: FAD-binding oxidoreductase [Pseudomonadota bacterium]